MSTWKTSLAPKIIAPTNNPSTSLPSSSSHLLFASVNHPEFPNRSTNSILRVYKMGKRTKNKANGLGRSLTKAKNKEFLTKKAPSERHSVDEERETTTEKLKSVLEENDLNHFMAMAQLANREFTALRDTVTFVVNDVPTVYNLDEKDGDIKERKNATIKEQHLPVPRRPKWSKQTTKQQLQELERESFLKWRRSLASVEQDLSAHVTPYEKNLNVWRQLWRVIERSQVVVQIVDCRNPLIFRSIDLENYVKELDSNKRNILLLNKADLLTKKQRFKWAQYLHKNDINYLFFSALSEQDLIDKRQEETKVDVDDIDTSKFVPPDQKDWTHVYSREQLLCYFKSLIETLPKVNSTESNQQSRIIVGMVGYPNVGKSSLINVLCGKKRVAVGSTPGKTKHFQTIPIGENILLCDCPGLVFPSVRTTRDDMYCDGILPIDQMREYRGPVGLICKRIPASIFEMTYGLKFDRHNLQTLLEKHDIDVDMDQIPLTVDALLSQYAESRSIMSQKGVANASHVARIILKDYVSGKLIYCHPPPSIDETPLPQTSKTDNKPKNISSQDINASLEKQDNNDEQSDDEIVVDEEDLEGGDDEYFTESEDDEDDLDEEKEKMNRGKTQVKSKHELPSEPQPEDIIEFGHNLEELDEETKTIVDSIKDRKFNESNINVTHLKVREQKKKKKANPNEENYHFKQTNPIVSTTKQNENPQDTSSILKKVSQSENYHEEVNKLKKRQDLTQQEKKELKLLKRRHLYAKKYGQ